jgi:hypothetical protein
LPVGVHDFEAAGQSFNLPRRGEATLSHLLSLDSISRVVAVSTSQ